MQDRARMRFCEGKADRVQDRARMRFCEGKADRVQDRARMRFCEGKADRVQDRVPISFFPRIGRASVWHCRCVGKLKRLRSRFNLVAEGYDAARPAYPSELFDDLVLLANLRPEARVLEIGSGAGKATRPLLERGYQVICVELGARLAEQARRNLAPHRVPIHVGAFESWAGPLGAFDLVFAATAWHWIRPTVRYAKAHALLRPGGCLAFWSALHAFPPDFDRFFEDIRDVYQVIGSPWEGEWPPPTPDETPDERAQIEATGLFRVIGIRRYLWEVRYTAAQYIALLGTFSGHIEMDPSKREYLFREIRTRIDRRREPTIRRHWRAILHVARRADA